MSYVTIEKVFDPTYSAPLLPQNKHKKHVLEFNVQISTVEINKCWGSGYFDVFVDGNKVKTEYLSSPSRPIIFYLDIVPDFNRLTNEIKIISDKFGYSYATENWRINTSILKNEIAIDDGEFKVQNVGTWNGGFVGEDATIKTSVVNIPYMPEQYTVTNAVYYYKKKAAETYSTYNLSGDGTYTIPYSLFENGFEYDNYIRFTSDDGKTYDLVIGDITTIDGVPTVECVFPVNDISKQNITFKWNYSTPKSNKQYAFDLEVSEDGISWDRVANHVISSLTSYTYEFMHTGESWWRVRAYNQNNVVGEWSSAKFINRAIPRVTELSASGYSRLNVSWSSTEQSAYSVTIKKDNEVVHASGVVYDDSRSYYANQYLLSGDYVIELQLYSRFGDASEVYTTEYTVSYVGNAPTLEIIQNEGFATINFDEDGANKYYLLRNGELVGLVHDGYNDYYLNGKTTYTLIKVAENDSINAVTRGFEYKCNLSCLIDEDGNILYLSRRMNEVPKTSNSFGIDGSFDEYIGRNKPVFTRGEMTSRAWSVSCGDCPEVGKLYFYRNYKGDYAWVAASSVSRGLNFRGLDEYSFTLREVERESVVAYEV